MNSPLVLASGEEVSALTFRTPFHASVEEAQGVVASQVVVAVVASVVVARHLLVGAMDGL